MDQLDDFARAAAYLVKEHGERASSRASWLAEWYRKSGDAAGYQNWSRVASTILDLLASEKPDDKSPGAAAP